MRLILSIPVLAVLFWLGCRIQKQQKTPTPAPTPITIQEKDTIKPRLPSVKLESVTLQEPVYIAIPGKDSIERVHIQVARDTQNFKKYFDKQFEEVKLNLEKSITDHDKQINKLLEERMTMAVIIRELRSDKAALVDSVTVWKLKFAQSQVAIESSRHVIYDMWKIAFGLVLLLVILGWLRQYFYKRTLRNELKKLQISRTN